METAGLIEGSGNLSFFDFLQHTLYETFGMGELSYVFSCV